MKTQLTKLISDLKKAANYDIPKIENIDAIMDFLPSHGMRVGWLFKEDVDFYKKERLNAREYSEYSGILVLRPDAEYRGGGGEIEDFVLIIDSYPCEKCYPEIDYIAFAAFLDAPDLAEVFSKEKPQPK